MKKINKIIIKMKLVNKGQNKQNKTIKKKKKKKLIK